MPPKTKTILITLIAGTILLWVITLAVPKPTYSKVYIQLAQKAESNNNFNLAEKYFKKAIEQNPKDPAPYYLLGRLYADQNNQNLKSKYFVLAAEQGAREPDALLEAGIYFKNHHDYPKAIEFLNRANSKHDTFAEAFLELGKIALDSNDLEKADFYFQRCVTAKTLPECFYYKGILYIKTNNIAEAKGEVKRLKGWGNRILADQLTQIINRKNNGITLPLDYNSGL